MGIQKKTVVTVPVKGEKRVKALETLKSRDHSSFAAILNKGLDLLIEREMGIEALCAGE